MTAPKLPFDLRVVIALGILSSAINLGLTVLLALDIAHVPADVPGRALFGTIVLSTDLSRGILEFAVGIAGLIYVYGLWHRARWGWWYGLVFMVYALVDSAFSFRSDPINVAVAMLLSAGIIIWLLYRRELFGVGSQTNGKGERGQLPN